MSRKESHPESPHKQSVTPHKIMDRLSENSRLGEEALEVRFIVEELKIRKKKKKGRIYWGPWELHCIV
jgi:hypothetical protein